MLITLHYKTTLKRDVEQSTDKKSSRKDAYYLPYEMNFSEFNVRTSHAVAIP